MTGIERHWKDQELEAVKGLKDQHTPACTVDDAIYMTKYAVLVQEIEKDLSE